MRTTFNLTLGDDVERVAGIVLEQDDGVFGVGAVARHFHHPLQVGGGELTEQRDLLQHVSGDTRTAYGLCCGGVN